MTRVAAIGVSAMLISAMLLAACGAGSGSATGGSAATPNPAASPSPATIAGAATPEAPTEPPAVLGSGSIKIVIWHGWDGAYRDAIQKIFSDYAAKNGVSIELLKVADLNNKVQVAVPTGKGPDIIAWVDDQIGKNALSKIIQPLDSYGVTQDYLNQTFTDVAAKAMVYDGKIYGVPESLEALTIIYNKKLIQAGDIPKDTDALLTQAKTYNATSKYLFVYNAQNDAYFSAPWWLGSGVTLVTPEGTTTLDSAEGIKAGQLIKSFSEIMPKELDYGVADALFKEGKAAMIMNGPWAIADYQKAGIDVGLATIPIISNSGKPGRPFVGVKMLMLAANAKNAQASVDLMKYYGSAEVQAQLAQVNKQVPANRQAQEQVKSDPIIAGFIAQAALGESLPNTQYIDALWDPIAKTVQAIWTGAQTPEAAVKGGAALFTTNVKDLQ
jgi:arabinogalactan oligomer/maltooligosaccharide transport system substrate-binding protein